MFEQFLARFFSPPGREKCFSLLSPGIQQLYPGTGSMAGLTVLASGYHEAEAVFTAPYPAAYAGRQGAVCRQCLYGHCAPVIPTSAWTQEMSPDFRH